MTGWRARLGFLLPPGNTTVEPEMFELAPRGVTVHFARLIARGSNGSLEGLEDRITSQLEHIDEPVELLANARPKVIVLGHTASSYRLGREQEQALMRRLEAKTGIPFVTAFAGVVAALQSLGVRKVALGTPYTESITRQAKAMLEDYGFEVVRFDWLRDVKSIFDETPKRAYGLGRAVDTPDAQAVFLSGTGMPTLSVVGALERDLRKPVISSASAMMWKALQVAGITETIDGYGRLLAAER